MLWQRKLLLARFIVAAILAPLQLEILRGVCDSSTLVVARVIRAELSIAEVFPDLVRAAFLTALFLLFAGMLWSWTAKIEGRQAVVWFVVFGVVATLSPVVTDCCPATSLHLGLPIRLVLAIASTAMLYLGSSMLRLGRGRVAPLLH